MKSYTASERKGIIAVAVVALAITGAGLLTARCNRGSVENEVAVPAFETETIMAPDSVKTDKERTGEKRGKSRKIRSAKPQPCVEEREILNEVPQRE